MSAAQRQRLHELFSQYPAVAQASALKESFRHSYRSPTRAVAQAGLARWEASVRACGLAPSRRLFQMLRDWHREILNDFDHRYRNGFVEDKNNRIKASPLRAQARRVIKRTAYGYRNGAHFRQRMLLTNLREVSRSKIS